MSETTKDIIKEATYELAKGVALLRLKMEALRGGLENLNEIADLLGKLELEDDFNSEQERTKREKALRFVTEVSSFIKFLSPSKDNDKRFITEVGKGFEDPTYYPYGDDIVRASYEFIEEDGGLEGIGRGEEGKIKGFIYGAARGIWGIPLEEY